MARMRFQGDRRPRTLHETARPDTRVSQLGDVPDVPPKPGDLDWLLESYPYPPTHYANGRRKPEPTD